METKKSLKSWMIGLMIVAIVASLQLMASCALYGNALLVLYPIAALVFFIPTLAVVCELATAHPITGGSYVWVEKAFGKSWGFFTVCIQWLANIVWYPTIFSFIAAALAFLIDPALASDKQFVLWTVLGLFWGVTLFNFLGIKVSGWISSVCALGGILLPIALLAVLGGVWLAQGHAAAIPFSLNNSSTNLAVLTQIIISLTGLEMALVHIGDVERPRRTIPRALAIAGCLVFLIVVSGPWIIAQILPPDQIDVVSGLLDAFSRLFESLALPSWILPLVLILVFAGNWGNVTAWMISSTRGMQIACENCQMPSLFTLTNRAKAPVGILLIEGAVFTLLTFLMVLFPRISDGYWFLIILASQIALLYYWLILAAALRLRKSRPIDPDAYRIPGGNWGIGIAAALGIASTGAGLVFGFFPPNDQTTPLFPLALLLGIGLIFLFPAALLQLSKRRKNISC